MRLNGFWPVNGKSVYMLSHSLKEFAPRPMSHPEDLNAMWHELKLDRLIDDRSWSAVATASASGGIEDAMLSLREQFAFSGVTPGPSHRGAVIVPDGIYELDRELNMLRHPWFDIFGESKEGTIIRYGSQKKEAVLYTKASHGIFSHMTIERYGDGEDMSGNGVRYAIHDNTPSSSPRTCIFAEIECKTPLDTGVGTGVCSGGIHIYSGVNCDNGFFAHNADDIREAWESGAPRVKPKDKSFLMYLNCTAGASRPVTARFGVGLTYWNTGSGQPDILAICGGEYNGSSHSVRVVDFGLPFAGNSETEVFVIGDVGTNGVLGNVCATDKTKIVEIAI